jgi:hypothetical protein
MRAGGTHHGQECFTPPKAEYICADQKPLSFRLQLRGGPYIPITRNNSLAPCAQESADVGLHRAVWPAAQLALLLNLRSQFRQYHCW